MSLNTIIISRGPKGEDGGAGGGDLSQTDIDSLAKLNGIVADATLIDTGDARLSDARTPTAHTHTLAEISDAGTAAAAATGDFATAAHTHTLSDISDAGTAAAAATGDFATAAQGTKADSAVQEGDSPSFVDVTASGTVTAGAGTFNADGNVLTAKRIDDPSKKLEIINDLDGNVQFRINGSTRLLLRHNQLVLLESGTQLSTGENEFRINAGEDTLFKFSSTKGAAWGPNAYAYGAMDTGLFRVSPGTLALGNGLQYNDSGSLNLTNLTASGTVKTGSYTVATLPTPSTGMRAQVTDSNRAAANNFGSTVIAAAGGTQYTVPVFYDGTDWIIA